MQFDNQTGPNYEQSFTKIPITTVLIEEHKKVRQALAQSLTLQPRTNLVRAMSYLPSQPENLFHLNPKVILIGFPQHLTTDIHTLVQHIQTWLSAGIMSIVLTPYLDPEEEEILFLAGAFAYVHKTIDAQKLQNIISTAHLFSESLTYKQLLTQRRKTMFKRILVPVDGSELAEKAIDKAMELAAHFQAEVYFLRVYSREQMLADPISPFDTYHLVVTAEDAQKRATDYLETLQTKFAALDIAVQARAVESADKAGKAIAAYAAENDIDMIVMTSHGYTGFRRLVMGSVTTELLHHALCPALIVPALAEL